MLYINLETGMAAKVNNYSGVTSSTYASRTGDAFTAFYIVPGSTDLVPPSTAATSITLDITEISVLKGSDFSLNETVYAGSDTYTVPATSTATAATYPTCNYYILTESGDVWYFSIYAIGSNLDFEICEQKYICNVNLTLEGVSAVTGGAYASMIYDEVSGSLILSSYTEGDSAKLYALDMVNAIYADLGSFGDGVWPVVSMYRYERPTDLAVRITPKTVSLYEGEQSSLTAKVLPVSFTGGVVWSSSDETVATVDADGIVTGVGNGTVTITATSVDVNAAGETVSASITVNVSGLAKLDITFNAQVTTDDGTSWATINTSDLNNYTVNGKSDVVFKGGGAHQGKIWGHDVNPGTMEGVTHLTSLYTDYEINFDNGEGDAAKEIEATATSASSGLLLCDSYTGEAISEEPVAAINTVGGTNTVSASAVHKEHPAVAVNSEAQVADNSVTLRKLRPTAAPPCSPMCCRRLVSRGCRLCGGQWSDEWHQQHAVCPRQHDEPCPDRHSPVPSGRFSRCGGGCALHGCGCG